MLKKKHGQILFTNDQYLQRPRRGNRVQSKPTEVPRPKIKSFDFKYTFNQYVKLSLSKIIPAFANKVTFIPSKSIIIGHEEPCNQLIAQAAEELQSYRYIPVKKLTEGQLDMLDYELDDGIRLFRPGVVRIALSHLDPWDCFKQYIDNMNEEFGQNASMMRFQRSLSEKAMSIKNRVLELNTSRTTHQEAVQTEVSGLSQRMGNSVTHDSQFSMTMLEHDEFDDDEIVTIGETRPKKELSTSSSDHSFCKQDHNKSSPQAPEEEESFSSLTMHSILETSEATINITEADHTNSHHVYRSKDGSREEQPVFILQDIDLDAPL